MKTKTGLVLLFCLGFYASLFAQLQIVGPEALCVGEVGIYEVYENGQPSNEDYSWVITGGGTTTGAQFIFDAFAPGLYEIIILSPNGVILADYTVLVESCFFEIVGPPTLCVGECADYSASNTSFVTWEWTGTGEATMSPNPISGVYFCIESPGIFYLSAFDQLSGLQETIEITALGGSIPDIISLSGAFCTNDSLSNCDRVCENTSVTYVTELTNPGAVVNWSVSGAENWVENGNEVTVEWGDPGQGQVSLEVSSNSDPAWFLSCSSFQPEVPGVFNGIGLIYVDGPPGLYTGQLNNGTSVSFSSNEEVYLQNLSAGNYVITVTDDMGISASCTFSVGLEQLPSICSPFGVYFDVTLGNDPDCCENIIEPILAGNVIPPFSYTWSNGQTDHTIHDACAGLYSLTVTDANGCTTAGSVQIYCPPTNNCSSSNSLCVDILEIPEAAFQTDPPANNGIVEICEGQTVFFENLTNGGFNYTWDFGTGVSSSNVDAQHTYLSAGTYEAILIARNDCFCGDSSSVTIIVEEAITPEIDCAGTICPGEEITYTSNADCSEFYWNISSNGTIISGGGTSDDFITVDWGAGPEGIIELSVGACNGDYCLQTLFENIPIIDDNAEIRGPIRVCKGTEVIYSMPSFAGTEFIWSVTSFGTITDGQGTNEITVQWANEVTPITQQIAVEYESCFLGCGGSDILDVNILNEIYIEGPIEACPDQLYTYTCRTPLGGLVNADWTVYDNTGSVVTSSAGPTPDYNLNWIYGSGNFTVEASVQNATNYCIDNFSIFVEVVPETDIPTSISGELEICPGISYAYTGASGAGMFDYTWYITDGGTNYILNGKTVNVTWGAAPPYLLELTQTNLDGFACESDPISATPNSINTVALSGTQSVCKEEIGNYLATAYPNLEYEWSITPSDAGSVINGENTNAVEIQWHSVGTYDLQVTVCGVSEILPVTVNPLPTPSPILNPVCPGATGPVSLTLPYNTYQWLNESGTTVSNAAVPNLSTGYYEVIVTDNNGCTGIENFYLPTYGQPDVTISTPDFGNFCANGGSMTLYALETSSGPLDYQWYFNGTPFGANSSAQVITQEGNYYVMVTDINGCTAISNTLGLLCIDLPGGPPPPPCPIDGFAAFEMSQGVFCNNSQYTNTSVNDVDDTWYWEFVDIVSGNVTSSTLENPEHTWTNAGFNIVAFFVDIKSTIPGETCRVRVLQFDTIPLVANFVFEEACELEPVTFEDISTFIPQTNIMGWDWDFGDPTSGAANTSTLQNPEHIYNTAGTYTVTLTTTDLSGCISVKSQTVEVFAPPVASFAIPQASCEGSTLPFEADGNFSNVTWDFGDPGSGAANTSNLDETYHVFSSDGVFDVSLTVENIYGCMESIVQQVTIEANSLSGFISANPGLEVCEGDSVILTAPLSDAYLWSNNAVTPSITVTEAGSYSVTIYDALGCEYSPPVVVVDLIPLPQAEITAVEYNEFDQPTDYFYNNYETCFGEDVYLEITDNPDYTYEWPDGEVSTEVSFTDDKGNLLSIGTHVFEVEIADVTTGCTNTIGPFTVTVHPVPENIIIQSSPSAPVCENTPTTMTVFNPDPTYTYIWNTGEVGTTINTFYAGEYFVRAINQFGCEGESNTLEIVPGPNVDLIPSGCHARCNPDTMCLPPVMGVSSFQWYLNGTPLPPPNGSDPNFIATESGEYYVEMVSVDGCVTISDVLTLDLYDGFGSILGEVYFDLNENGIIDAGDTLMSGIGVILQENGVNLDTLTSNQIGSVSFSNILSTDYNLIIDELNLPPGMTAIINQVPASLLGCDDEDAVQFLIQFICTEIQEDLTLYACTGDSVIYDGVELNIGDTQVFELLAESGCDSTVTVTVDGIADNNFTLNLAACTGTTLDYNGNTLNPGSSTEFLFTSTGGCDSIVTVVVEELLTYEDTVNLEACTGEFVFYNNENFLAGTSQTLNYFTENNCDSLVTIIVEELTGSMDTLSFDACQGSPVIFDGVPLDPGTTMDFTYVNDAGCDSIITVMIGAFPLYNLDLELFACEGSTVEYDGENLAAGSVTEFLYTTAAGCDSTMIVSVTPLLESTFTINVSACDDDTYPYNGTNLPPGSSTDFTFTNVAGCDSIVTVNVGTWNSSETVTDLFVCPGETIIYNGMEIGAGFEEEIILTNQNGCDSIIQLAVTAYPDFSYTVQTDASCWNDNSGSLFIENLTGGTAPFQYSIDGQNYQDSTTFLNMDNGSFMVSVIDGNSCEKNLEVEVETITALEFEMDIPEVPCSFDAVTLELQNLSPNPGPLTYLWEDGSINSFINVDTPGVYTVEISNACETIVETFSVPLAEHARKNFFFAPNVFSPNNDGMNDSWKVMPPDDMEVLSFELYLFDRWGNTLRRFDTVYDSWDGSFKENDLKPGVYVFWYRATVLSCGRSVEIFDKGDVTIVR